MQVASWLGVIGLTVDETKTTLLRSKHGSSPAKNMRCKCSSHMLFGRSAVTEGLLHSPLRFISTHVHKDISEDALYNLDTFVLVVGGVISLHQ